MSQTQSLESGGMAQKNPKPLRGLQTYHESGHDVLEMGWVVRDELQQHVRVEVLGFHDELRQHVLAKVLGFHDGLQHVQPMVFHDEQHLGDALVMGCQKLKHGGQAMEWKNHDEQDQPDVMKVLRRKLYEKDEVLESQHD